MSRLFWFAVALVSAAPVSAEAASDGDSAWTWASLQPTKSAVSSAIQAAPEVDGLGFRYRFALKESGGLPLRDSDRVRLPVGTYGRSVLAQSVTLSSGSCRFQLPEPRALVDNADVELVRAPDSVCDSGPLEWQFELRSYNAGPLALWFDSNAHQGSGCLSHAVNGSGFACLQGRMRVPSFGAAAVGLGERLDIPWSAPLIVALLLSIAGIVIGTLVLRRRPRDKWLALAAVGLAWIGSLYWFNVINALKIVVELGRPAAAPYKIHHKTSTQPDYHPAQAIQSTFGQGDNRIAATLPKGTTSIRLELPGGRHRVEVRELRVQSGKTAVIVTGALLLGAAVPLKDIERIARESQRLVVYTDNNNPMLELQLPTQAISYTTELLRPTVYLLFVAPWLLLFVIGIPVLSRFGALLVAKGEYALLIVGLPLTLCYALLTPPFMVPDEPEHLMRLRQITSGQIMPVFQDGTIGGVFAWPEPGPSWTFGRMAFKSQEKTSRAEILQELDKALTQPPGAVVFRPMRAAVYSPIAYSLQLPGAVLAAICGAPPLWQLYAARVSAALGFMLLVFWATRRLPRGKLLAVAIVLLPMCLYEAGGVSADATCISSCLVMVTCILGLAEATSETNETKIRSLRRILVASAVVLAMAKGVYALLAFSALSLWPIPRFRKIAIATPAAALAASMIWSSFTYSKAIPSVSNNVAQMEVLLHQPWFALEVLARTLWFHSQFHVQSLIGIFGWLDGPLTPGTYVLAGLMLIVAFAASTAPSRSYDFIPLVLAGGMLALIVTTMYIVNTPYGAMESQGTQGRYIVPLTFAILPLCAHTTGALRALLVFGMAAFINARALIALVERFYG